MTLSPHPKLVTQLFAHRHTVFCLFQKLIKPYGIDHIAVSHIDAQRRISILSSTPSLEYTLFQHGLWQHDKSYQTEYFKHASAISWEALYTLNRYDELHYIKQLRTYFELGVSFIAQNEGESYIISLATQHANDEIRHRFTKPLCYYHDMLQAYLQKLSPLFIQYK